MPERNPNDCIHCGGWTCSHCRPLHDPGEQGLTADEKETIALKNRVRELEAERDTAIDDGLKAERELKKFTDDRPLLVKDRDAARVEAATLMDSMEIAWGVIANAHGGDWSSASQEWREAAEQWRDKHWHAALALHAPAVRP